MKKSNKLAAWINYKREIAGITAERLAKCTVGSCCAYYMRLSDPKSFRLIELMNIQQVLGLTDEEVNWFITTIWKGDE